MVRVKVSFTLSLSLSLTLTLTCSTMVRAYSAYALRELVRAATCSAAIPAGLL